MPEAPSQQEQCGEAFGSAEQWRRVFSTRHRNWRRVGSRAAAGNARKRVDLSCFLLPFPADCEDRRCPQKGKNQNERNKQ